MKTNKQNKKEKQNKSELQSRSEQLSGNNNSQTATAPAQPAPQKTVRPYVNFEERDRNRQLPVEKVLDTLRQWMPRAYELAEVVGKWIWITFPEQPVEKLRADLSQLGFHWNTRQPGSLSERYPSKRNTIEQLREARVGTRPSPRSLVYPSIASETVSDKCPRSFSDRWRAKRSPQIGFDR
jgi:hypothetical protein